MFKSKFSNNTDLVTFDPQVNLNCNLIFIYFSDEYRFGYF